MKELYDFVGELRAAGLSIGTDRIVAAAAALAVLPAEPYWPLRVTLCARPADLRVFDAVWRSGHTADIEVQVVEAVPAAVGAAAAPDITGADPERTDQPAGGEDRTELTRRDVRRLTASELAEIRRLIGLLAPAARRRPAMRRAPARTGRVDAARTMRLILRNGGEPSRILRTRRTWRPRRLLMLIDVSGSMSAYSDVLLRFAHAAVAAGPAVTEVFTVGTRWARLTDQLRAGDADAAMAAVAKTEFDWDGSTTLGPALRDFLRRWGGRAAIRSAVVVIGSDGMESGDLTELPRQVARLSRLGHTVIWVNPARAVPGYQPLNPALIDSLRFVTAEVSGHHFNSLRRLAEVIAR
jgi:uncharacterized protein with von Willebrand factor type A (vWA) domain